MLTSWKGEWEIAKKEPTAIYERYHKLFQLSRRIRHIDRSCNAHNWHCQGVQISKWYTHPPHSYFREQTGQEIIAFQTNQTGLETHSDHHIIILLDLLCAQRINASSWHSKSTLNWSNCSPTCNILQLHLFPFLVSFPSIFHLLSLCLAILGSPWGQSLCFVHLYPQHLAQDLAGYKFSTFFWMNESRHLNPSETSAPAWSLS